MGGTGGVAYDPDSEEDSSSSAMEEVDSCAFSSTNGTTTKKTKFCCDACDGEHRTHSCPHYKKKRPKHPDARRRKKGLFGEMAGGEARSYIVRSASVRRQPGDNSCLFHSIAAQLPSPSSARALRRELVSWIRTNSTFEIADSPLSDWVRSRGVIAARAGAAGARASFPPPRKRKNLYLHTLSQIEWDGGGSVRSYCRRMGIARSWGGGIEMAACSQLKRVNVWVR